MAMVGTALFSNVRAFALAITVGFSDYCCREPLSRQPVDFGATSVGRSPVLELLCPSEREIPSNILAVDKFCDAGVPFGDLGRFKDR